MTTPNFTAPASLFDRMLAMSRAWDDAEQLAGGRARQQLWLPPIDVYETADSFVLEADLPGVHPENVELSFEQNTLTLKGTRAPTLQANERGEMRVYTAERVTGAFARSVRLPEYVEGDKIEATYNNGVLTIVVPKAQSALPRKIAVRSTGETARRLGA